MLVVHSSSRCDVCLSEYSWDTSSKRPHAIACGHIFCRDCLYANTPPLCPLCRHIYQPNKMKRLHVDKPEDIDDHKEVDLLQRLIVSWDTPPEQLQEVMDEVDLWLDNRSEEACVALRKARHALSRTRELKDDERHLLNAVHSLEDEIQQRDASMTREQLKSRTARELFTAQIDSMTKEIYDLRAQVERFQTHYYSSKYTSKNPLPAPPRPLLTPNLPSFEQALSESGSGTRIMELPSSPMSQYPKFEVETHKKPKRRSNLAEQHYTSSAYDDSRYQQGSSTQAAPTREVTPSHYVQAHINVVTHDQSPQAHSIHSQPELESTNSSLDVYTITHAYLREYSTGFLSGQQAAIGNGRRKGATRGIYAPRQPTQPATAFEQPVDEYRPSSTNIYRNHPHSAPATREVPPLRTQPRRNTAQSSILSSSSSPVHSGSDSSRSRSRSRGARGSSASLTQDVQFSNSRLASIMLGAEPGPPEPPLLRQPSPIRSPPLPPQELDQPPASNRPRSSSDRRGSPSAQSRRTWDSGSWGTPAPSHLTDGSVISGLRFFRSGVPRPTSFDGQEITNFPLLNSDGQSVRTRQSISDLGHDESTLQISRSPPRPVDTMVGVIPSDLNPGLYRNAYSESHLLQHFNSNGHATRPTHSSGHYGRDEDRFPPQESRNPLNGHSNSHPERHLRSTHEERSQYRSPAPLDSPVPEPAWGDPWASGQGNGYATNGSSWPYPNDVHPPPQAEHRHLPRTGSDENARRGRPRRTRPAQSLPAESPADAAADYGYGDSYGAQPHTGHGAAPRIVGHAEPEAAPPSSFMGNALGLELAAGPTSSINAPTPMVPLTLLRSWSQDH